jgi:serine/threonine protein kinase
VAGTENAYIRRGVGRYRLYGAIAAGGMATVHYGRMQAPLGFARTVAIKRLHREYARDPEFVAMFMDEARLAARVHHPNVVQTLDVVASEGELFLVMEYVPAVSLSQLLHVAQTNRQRVPASVAAAIVAHVLQGLHAAHEATDEAGNPLDIVHRDVSPQNILVGADGAARVLDFGIAKASGRAAHATREGQVKGKFAYMAPEQITNVRVTRQSDIFAASIVLWEALTGTRLFQAESEPALLARVLSAPIPPPSAVAPELGCELDQVVLRGLARDLSIRYATAREMVRDLEAHAALANASQVGEWVERLSGEELAQRAARVAEIENESRSARVSVEAALATSIEAHEIGTAGEPKAVVRTRRETYGLGTLLVVAIVGAAAIVTGLTWGRSAPARAVERSAPSTAFASAQPPAAAPPPEKVPVPPDPPGARAELPAPASSARRPPASETRPAARPAVKPTAAGIGCDPPYYADSKGHLIYKPECFR